MSGVVSAAAFGQSPVAQSTITKFGIEFCVVGSPGNRPPDESEMTETPGNWRPGAVNYQYAIAKNELSSIQYLEFVRAYASFHPEIPGSVALTGDYIVANPGASGRTFDLIVPAVANLPTNMSWRMAASYCNWLVNGKAMVADSFEHGAYDTSTFNRDASGIYTDQLAHSPGAEFWIPNLDEYIKAANFDPDRYGNGEGGYWKYSGMSDVPLRFGAPQNGGQTNAGTFIPGVTVFPVYVGSYPLVRSPWGLLDTCGGISNWLEGTLYPDRPNTGVMDIGARIGNLDEQVFEYDRLGMVFSSTAPNSGGPGGLRIAMRIRVDCIGDLNGDQVVDDTDFSIFAVAYNVLDCGDAAMAVGCPADFNLDGVVDDADFLVFAPAYDAAGGPTRRATTLGSARVVRDREPDRR